MNIIRTFAEKYPRLGDGDVFLLAVVITVLGLIVKEPFELYFLLGAVIMAFINVLVQQHRTGSQEPRTMSRVEEEDETLHHKEKKQHKTGFL